MRLIRTLCLGLAVACLGAALAAPGAIAAPTIRQSLDLQTFAAPRMSPDGRTVVYEESRTNWDANAFETDLWMADVATGERQKLTLADKSSTDAAWSPDGRWIAFLSDRPGALSGSPKDKKQLWVMPAHGGEAQQLTRFDEGVKAIAWTADSRSLVIAAAGPEAAALKDRKATFGEFHVVHADYAMVHLWRTDLPVPDSAGRTPAPGEPTLLTAGEAFSVGEFAVSPDGAQIAFAAQRDPDLISSGTSRIYVIPAAGGGARLVAGEAGPNANPQWSPDGRRIAFETAAGDEFFFYANKKIAVVPAAGGEARVVDPDFDEDAHLLRWGPAGIYFAAQQKTQAGLFRLNPETGATRRVEWTDAPIARAFSIAENFGSVAFIGGGANQAPEVYAVSLAGGVPRRLTRGGDEFAGLAPAVREVVTWRSGDGTPVEGVLIRPATLEPGRKYPLLVVIHGGPTGVDTPIVSPDRYYPVERFVARGALVLRPNYRGSAGYGGKFRSLNVRNLGVGDYADVISGVDALIARGIVDPDRVGAMGWSEGGYISAFITTSSDRFKAVSVGAGISDWQTYYANTDITPFTAQYLKATPWSDPEIYRQDSPITYIAKARTPTLIQHGGADRRVPIANAYELRQALEDHGVPVKMVVYDGFGHPIDKPKQQRAVMEENEAWFGHYIFGDPLSAGLTPDKPASGGADPSPGGKPGA